MAKVAAVATEEEVLSVHPEWRDPAFDGLLFEYCYWLEVVA